MSHVWMVRVSYATGAFDVELFRTKAGACEYAKSCAKDNDFKAVSELQWERYHKIGSGIDFMTVLKVEVNK